MEKPTHIYWFAHYNTKGPCVRYRGKYFLEALYDRFGVPYSFVVPGYHPKNILHFLQIYFSALLFRKSGSIIVFQKIYTRGIYANALKFLLFFRKKLTIYDLDDAYHLKFPPATIFHFLQNTLQVSVGSEELLSLASKHNQSVFVNTSPIIAHSIIKKKRNDVFTIGWIGFYNAHSESLEQLFFPALKQSEIQVKLVLMGVTKNEHKCFLRELFPSSGKVDLEITENIDWEDEIFIYRQISRFDVGISPLLETSMNKAKSAFKMKQYLSVGVPVLASPVGENCRFLKEGYNGYFCNNPREFSDRIRQISEMPDDLYDQMSAHALESSAEFSIEQYCKRFLGSVSQTSNAKRQTSNVKCQTSNAKRQTLNAKRQTSNAKRQTSNVKRQMPNVKRQTPDVRLRISKNYLYSAIFKISLSRDFAISLSRYFAIYFVRFPPTIM